MRKLRILTVALALVGGGAIGSGTAVAEPSCVAQGATSFAPGDFGPTISGYARTYVPLGAIVSSEATSPKNACPPE